MSWKASARRLAGHGLDQASFSAAPLLPLFVSVTFSPLAIVENQRLRRFWLLSSLEKPLRITCEPSAVTRVQRRLPKYILGRTWR